MSADRIDVLAVFDRADLYLSESAHSMRHDDRRELREARAAVAELIAADREYDAAMARRVTATNAIVSGDRSDDAFRRQATTDHAFDRAVARRTAALASVGGAS